MENTDTIYAVVVTYNRLKLLQRTVECLRLQTRPLKGIVVVNNSSTDGTASWLAQQNDLIVLNQPNVGGAGGFASGIRYARGLGAQWIWCMDDDVFPRPACLEKMLPHTSEAGVGILAPRRLMEDKIFTNDFLSYNLTNPLASLHNGKLKKMVVNAPTDIAGTAFEGLFVSAACVDSIGLPNAELFIFSDDTDYCLRAKLAGYRILYIPDALMDKHHFFNKASWAERQQQKKWKRRYAIRNNTYLNHHYGRNNAVRYLRPFIGMFGYVLTVCITAPFSSGYQWKDIPMMWQAYKDGLAERLGKY